MPGLPQNVIFEGRKAPRGKRGRKSAETQEKNWLTSVINYDILKKLI